VRRAAYEKTPGLSWIRMEIGDDAALGQMLKRSGARCAIINACEELSLRFYPSVREVIRHLEKTAGVGGRRPLTYAVAAMLLWTFDMAPFAGAVWPGLGAGARAAAIALCGIAWAASYLVAAWLVLPARAALLSPLGSTVLLYSVFAPPPWPLGAEGSFGVTLSTRGNSWPKARDSRFGPDDGVEPPPLGPPFQPASMRIGIRTKPKRKLRSLDQEGTRRGCWI
jgi:hypothetical protein